jgi:hypothetical protein
MNDVFHVDYIAQVLYNEKFRFAMDAMKIYGFGFPTLPLAINRTDKYEGFSLSDSLQSSEKTSLVTTLPSSFFIFGIAVNSE